jgi:hypothetical protein
MIINHSYVITQHGREEGHHHQMLSGKLHAQRPGGGGESLSNFKIFQLLQHKPRPVLLPQLDGFTKRVTYLIASTTTILNSSEISDIKEEICFMSRSMLDSLPV